MTILIVLCTVLLVLDCLLLSLLVLVQLPKKEAGIGMAFGGGAADALFGAGSGTALSNLTKYTATAFFVLVFALSVMNNHSRHNAGSELKGAMQKSQAQSAPVGAPQAATPSAQPASNAAIPLTINTNSAASTTSPAQSGNNPATTNKK